MGGSESIGYLQLEVENLNLYAGQEISGVIHFKLDQGFQASFLYLKFKGKETCHWTETRTVSTGKSTVTYTEHYNGHADIVRQKFPVFAFAGGFVDPGHFSFPFRFTLPNDIPGTFHLKEGSTNADINYELTAQIDDVKKQVKKSTAGIYVSQLHTAPIYSVTDSVNAQISTCCCRKQGNIQMKADFNKNAFVPGEIAEFIVEVNNNSRLDVQRLKGRLFRRLRLRCDSGKSKVFQKDLSTQEEERQISPGASAAGEERIRILLPIQDSKGELQQCASVNGTRIECVYAINVHAYMNGRCMCCGDKRDIERVVSIYPPQLPSPEMPVIPSDWNPQVMPVIQFSISQDFDYKPSAPLMQDESGAQEQKGLVKVDN